MQKGICKVKTNVDFNSYVEVLASGSASVLDFKNTEDMGGKPLTKNARAIVLRSAIEAAIDPEIINNLQLYLKELLEPAPKTMTLAALTDAYFNIKINLPSIFLRFLSSGLNLNMYKEIKGEIRSATTEDFANGRIVRNTAELQESLKALWKKKFNTLYYLVNRRNLLRDINFDEDFYNNVYVPTMKSAEKILSGVINTRLNLTSGKIDVGLTKAFRDELFEPLKSFITLSNFDNLITAMSSEIEVGAEYEGVLSEENKWAFKKETFYQASFLDGFALVNGDSASTNQLKEAFSRINLKDGKLMDLEPIRQLVEHINHAFLDREFNKYLLIIYSEESTLALKKQAFLELLKTDLYLQTEIGRQKCLAIADWFEKYNALYNRSIPQDASEKMEYETQKDLLGLLIATIKNLLNAVYILSTTSGNSIKTGIDRAQSKKFIYESIIDTAVNNRKEGKDYIYSSGFEVAPALTLQTVKSIASDRVLAALSKMFGLSFRSPAMQSLFSDNSKIRLLGDTCALVLRLYAKHFKYIDALNKDQMTVAVKSFRQELTNSPIFVDFSNELVATQAKQLHKLLSLDDNALPGETLFTTSGAFKLAAQSFIKSFPSTSNVLILDPGLTSIKLSGFSINDYKGDFVGHVCFRGDVEITDKSGEKKIVSAVLLEPSELMTISLNTDYLASILNGDVLYLLIEGYSDKPRIVMHAYNMLSRDLKTPLYQQTTTTLKLMYFQLNKSYFEAVENNVVEKYNKLFGTSLSNITEVAKFLEENNVTERDVHARLKAYQTLHPEENFNFIKDADYVLKERSINGEKIQYVGLNSSLLLKIASAKSQAVFDAMYNDGLNQFLDDMRDSENIPLTLMSELDLEQRKKICSILGISEEEFIQFARDNSWNKKELNGELTELSKKILSKYYALQTLLKDADLQIGIKQPWIHDIGMKGVHLSGSEVEALMNGTRNIDDILKKDYSVRLVKGKKRNSSGVTTFTPMLTDLRSGVGKTMKVAMVTFPKAFVENHFGVQEDSLHPHDGASFTNPIFSILEEHSYPGHKYEGPKKTIGLIQHPYGFTQIKHADYTMNNEWLRRSFSNPALDCFNGNLLMRKMLSPAKLTETFKLNLWKRCNLSGQYKSYEILESNYYYFNGKLAWLDSLDVDKNGNIKFNWRYLNNGEFVSQNLINQLSGTLADERGYRNIDNLYQLWQAIGGANVLEETEDGDFIDSESSNIICAELIAEFDTKNELKESMIAKICDPESVKSSLIAVNSAQDLLDLDDETHGLTTATIKCSQYGLQQDYTHESADARIPALTQVITAIAFNGNNIDLVNNAYEALGRIIQNSLNPIINKTNELSHVGTKSFHIYLGEKLLRSLLKNSVASTAMEIVQSFLDDLAEDKVLAYSNKDLFYKVTSDLVASLNKDTLKLTFSGTAVTQNPAYGIVGLYEDTNGIIYTRSDILKLANTETDFTQYELVGKLLSDLELVDHYLATHSEFEDEIITRENLDKINFGDVVDGKRVDSFKQLDAIYSRINKGKTVIKNHKLLRNLAVVKITWTETTPEGKEITLNLFNTGAIKALVTAKTEVDKNLAKLWYIKNLETLQTEGYYITDIKGYMRAVENKSDIEPYIKKITNYKYTPGEQVIPKVHTEFRTGNHSYYEIQKLGQKYFRPDIERRLVLDSKIDPKTEIGLVTDGGELILTQNNIDPNLINTLIEYDEVERRLCIKDLNRRFLCWISDVVIPTETPGIYINTKTNLQYNIKDYHAVLGVIGDKPLLTIHFPKNNIKPETIVLSIDDGVNKNVNVVYADKKLGLNKYSHDLIDNDLQGTIEKLTKAKYISWNTQHYTISARIPSQSYQSFLPTRTVAYTLNGLNMGYMNIWEMWFQGSDFDIDKAYTLMYSVDKKGRIQGNIFTNYDSVENVQRSLNLPLPKYGEIELSTNDDTALLLANIKFDNPLVGEALWKNILDRIEVNPDYKLIQALIENANKLGIIRTNDLNSGSSKSKVLAKLISYKYEGQESLKNRIANAIWTQASDLRNLISSESPMSSKYVTLAITEVLKRKHLAEGKKEEDFSEDIYNSEYNPFTIFKTLKNNSVGKQDVGIAANGVKAAGALLQHFNNKYQLEVISDRDRINLDLWFKDKAGREIGKFKFFKLANTKTSEKVFLDLLRTSCLGVNGVPDYNLHPQYQEYLGIKDEVIKEGKLEGIYDTYKRVYGKTPTFELLMYFALQFEDNVADVISIFISLATDNAKELALAKIAGTPDLLSMPLAMITLGMDINTVVDICVNILSDVEKALSYNRFNTIGKKDVRLAIASLKTKGYDYDTINSLLSIQSFAQELTLITRFFSVNLGVETKFAELETWISLLTQGRSIAAKLKGIKDLAPYKKPINFSLLFVPNSEERTTILQQYDASKTVVNVMDVVLESPHFSQLLKSTADLLGILDANCAKIYLINRLLNINGITNEDDLEDVGIDMEDMTGLKKTALVRKGLRLIDHYVITNYLKTEPNLEFAVADIQRVFPNSTFENIGVSEIIQLATNTGVNKFLLFMETVFIPYLLEKYPNNMFVDGLELKTRGDKTYWDFKYDPYAIKDNPTLLDNYNLAQAEFQTFLKNVKTGIHSALGHEFTVGELLYLYSVITSKGLTKGMYTVVSSVVEDSKLLNGGIERQYENLDRLVQQRGKKGNENAEEKLLLIIKELTPYVAALAEDDLRATLSTENGGTYSLDLNENYLYTLNQPVLINARVTDTLLVQYLLQILPFTEITLNIAEGSKQITYGVKVKGVDGSYVTKSSKENNNFKIDLKEGYNSTNGIPVTAVEKIVRDIVEFATNARKFILLPGIDWALKNTLEFLKLFINLDLSNIEVTDKIKSFLKSSGSIAIQPKTGSNFVRLIGDLVLYFIDPLNFDVTNNDEKNKPMLFAVDLYLQSLAPTKNISDNLKIAALINDVAGYEICTGDTYLKVVKDLRNEKTDGLNKDTFERLKLYKDLILDYAEFLFARNELEETKHNGQLLLAECENALRNIELYYIEQPLRVDNGMLFKPQRGDIIELNDGSRALCLGNNKNQNTMYIIVANNIEDVRILYDVAPENIKTYKRLLLNKEIRLGLLTENDFDYTNNLYKLLEINDLLVGDKFEYFKQAYFVSNVLVHRLTILNQSGYPESRVVKRLILTDTSNNALVVDQNPETGVFEFNNKPFGNIELQVQRPRQNTATETGGYKVTLSSLLDSKRESVMKYVEPGAQIKTVNGGIQTVIAVENGSVYLTNGENLPLLSKDILEVYLSTGAIEDDNFLEELSTKTLIRKSKLEADIYFNWSPDFADGFIKSSTKQNDSYVHEYTAVRFISNAICPDVTVPGIMHFLDPALNASIAINDVFIQYQVPSNEREKGKTTVYKIIEDSKDGTYLAKKITYTLKTDNSIKTENQEIVSITKDELDRLNHYSETIYEERLNDSVKLLSKEDAFIEFVDRIEKVTGLKIRQINDPTADYFAYVDPTGIVINSAKKPANMSIANYIMSQSTHEFLHVLFGHMRAKLPTLYFEIINGAKQNGLVEANLDTKSAEEALIRAIQSKDIEALGDNMNIRAIINRINRLLHELLGTTSNELHNTDMSLYSYLTRYSSDVVTETTSGLDIGEFSHLMINEKVFDKIKRIC